MKIRFFQKGFNYSQDGRGNRLVYHLQGCNMRCPWCANPEGMPVEGALMTTAEWLADVCCPKGAVKECELDRSMCVGCLDRPCVTKMRQKGIQLSCKEASVEEIIADCVSCKSMFFDGGGVTLTGGEVCMQLDAVKALLEGLGEIGIHRTIETNGSIAHTAELIPLVDEWIMDIKHWDDEKHRQWLGIGNREILHTLEKVCTEHSDVLIRIPMMPGFNDSEADAAEFAKLLAPYAARDNVRLEILTYHEFGKGKWAQCGKEYPMKGGRISPAQRLCLENTLRDAGMLVVRT